MGRVYYCSMKAYRARLLMQELELTVDTRVYNRKELFSLCKWKRFSLRSSAVTLYLQLK
jgi:hypothetical protein